MQELVEQVLCVCVFVCVRACVCIFVDACVVQDGVFRMSLSPDGAMLAVIHFSGHLSIWDVPSLKQRAMWSQEQQVRHYTALCVCVCACPHMPYFAYFEHTAHVCWSYFVR